jgi:hypothetical protein
MIYTIGNIKSYEKGFDEFCEHFRKLGYVKNYFDIGQDYEGGIVFKTIKDAEKYIKDNYLYGYGGYGIEEKWENRKHDGPISSLINTSKLVKIYDYKKFC